MSSPASSFIEARVLSALSVTSMASAAGYTLAAWTTPTHLFNGVGLGLIGGRNRGRMPYINYASYLLNWNQTTVEGGTLRAQIQLEAVVGGSVYGEANNLAQLMLSVACSLIRAESTDNYMAIGDDRMGQLEVVPWGSRLTAELDVELTYDRATYQVS